jgi:hypothetical protein
MQRQSYFHGSAHTRPPVYGSTILQAAKRSWPFCTGCQLQHKSGLYRKNAGFKRNASPGSCLLREAIENTTAFKARPALRSALPQKTLMDIFLPIHNGICGKSGFVSVQAAR